MTTPALDIDFGREIMAISISTEQPRGPTLPPVRLRPVNKPEGPLVELIASERAVPVEWLRRPAALSEGFCAHVATERHSVKKSPLRRLAYRWSVSKLVLVDPSGREWVAYDRPHGRAAKLELEEEFASNPLRSWRSHSVFELAGGVGKFVSLVHEEVHSVSREDPDSPEPARAKLSTIDLTTGEPVYLDKVIGQDAYERVETLVLSQLGQGIRQMITLLDLERAIRSSYAVTASETPGCIEIIVAVPLATGPSMNVLTFRVTRTPELDDLLETGFFPSSPRVHDEMLIHLHHYETVPREGIISDVRIFADIRRELRRRGWELRPKLYDGYGPAEGWDLRDMSGKRAGQKVRFYADGSVMFSSFTPEFTQTIRSAGDRVENAIWHNAAKRAVMGSEFARLIV